MSQISSINFKKSISINAEHNDRTLAPSYLLDPKKGVECNRNAKEARELKNQIIKDAIKNYTDKVGQKFQAKAYEWSAVVNIKPDTTMQDLKTLSEHFSKKYGFQCYQIAIHRDEGHTDENGQEQINHHAHLEFITLDKNTGKNRQRELTKPKLRELQTEVAEILQMKRGIDKRLSGVKRIEPRKYAQLKEQEKQTVIEATQPLKKEIEQERLTHAQTLKELEAIRKEMAGQGFTKEHFAYINELKKQQKEKTAEPMTAEQIQELKEQIAKKSGFFTKKDKIIEALTEKLTEAENDKRNLKAIVSFTEQNEVKIKEFIKQELENENKRILERLKRKQETKLNKIYKAKETKLINDYEKLQQKTEQVQKIKENATHMIKIYNEKREKLEQSDISKELKEKHEAELKKEQEKQAKLREQNEKLKADNETLRTLNEFAMEMKEKAEKELKEIKKQLQDITEAIERAVKGSWQIVYNRTAYGFKSSHIKLKEFFNKEPQEQERIINSNIKAHNDIEQEKKEKEQEKNKNRNRGGFER